MENVNNYLSPKFPEVNNALDEVEKPTTTVNQDADFGTLTPKSPINITETHHLPDHIMSTSEGSTAPEPLSSEANSPPDDLDMPTLVVTQETDPRTSVNLTDNPYILKHTTPTAEGSTILQPLFNEVHGIPQEELPPCELISRHAIPLLPHNPKAQPSTRPSSVDLELATQMDLDPENVKDRETDQSGHVYDASDSSSKSMYLNIEG